MYTESESRRQGSAQAPIEDGSGPRADWLPAIEEIVAKLRKRPMPASREEGPRFDAAWPSDERLSDMSADTSGLMRPAMKGVAPAAENLGASRSFHASRSAARKSKLVRDIVAISDVEARAHTILALTPYFRELDSKDRLLLINETIDIFADEFANIESNSRNYAALIITRTENYLQLTEFNRLVFIIDERNDLMTSLYRSHNNINLS